MKDIIIIIIIIIHSWWRAICQWKHIIKYEEIESQARTWAWASDRHWWWKMYTSAEWWYEERDWTYKVFVCRWSWCVCPAHRWIGGFVPGWFCFLESAGFWWMSIWGAGLGCDWGQVWSNPTSSDVHIVEQDFQPKFNVLHIGGGTMDDLIHARNGGMFYTERSIFHWVAYSNWRFIMLFKVLRHTKT